MLRSPVTRILYLFTDLLRVLETLLKNVSNKLSIGGLYANIINHLLFEIVSFKEIVSEILVSKSSNLFTIRPYLT